MKKVIIVYNCKDISLTKEEFEKYEIPGEYNKNNPPTMFVPGITSAYLYTDEKTDLTIVVNTIPKNMDESDKEYIKTHQGNLYFISDIENLESIEYLKQQDEWEKL